MQNFISNSNINAMYDHSDGTSGNKANICMERKSSDVGSHSQMDFAVNNHISKTEDSVPKQFIEIFQATKIISKRFIAKSIIQYIGNEGADVDARRSDLRNLFQALIDYVQKHDYPRIWENATVTVYDSADNTFKFQSGKGKHRFVVTAGNGVPKVRYIVNNSVKQLNENILKTILNILTMPLAWLNRLGGTASRYSEYTSIKDASEAANSIIENTPGLSAETTKMLQLLREDIYGALDGESSTRITIIVEGVNRGEPFKFKIGSGSQNLNINIHEDKINYQYSTGRYWTRFCRSAAKIFSSVFSRAIDYVGYFLHEKIEEGTH